MKKSIWLWECVWPWAIDFSSSRLRFLNFKRRYQCLLQGPLRKSSDLLLKHLWKLYKSLSLRGTREQALRPSCRTAETQCGWSIVVEWRGAGMRLERGLWYVPHAGMNLVELLWEDYGTWLTYHSTCHVVSIYYMIIAIIIAIIDKAI